MCMYIYIHSYISTCIYISVCICMYINLYIRIYIYLYIARPHMHLRAHTSTRTCTLTRIYTQGEVGEAVATAWRYAAVDSAHFEDAACAGSNVAAKISWDKLVFASRFLDARKCRAMVLGKFPGAMQRTLVRGGVHNLKQDLMTSRLGWLRGDATVVEALTFADSLRSIGGVAVVLALLETVTTSPQLVTLLQILKGVLWRNALNLVDMTHIKGYEVVAAFLQGHPHLVSGQVVDELMHIAGFGHAEQGALDALVANAEACEHLILDIRIWRTIDATNAAKVFQGLQALLAPGRRNMNAAVLDTISLVPFLCYYMYQPHVEQDTCTHIVGTLERFLAVTLRVQHLHLVAQLMLTGNVSPSGQVLELRYVFPFCVYVLPHAGTSIQVHFFESVDKMCFVTQTGHECYLCVYSYTNIFYYLCVYSYTNIFYIQTQIYIYILTYIYTYVYIYVYIYVHVYTYTYTYMHIHIHIGI